MGTLKNGVCADDVPEKERKMNARWSVQNDQCLAIYGWKKILTLKIIDGRLSLLLQFSARRDRLSHLTEEPKHLILRSDKRLFPEPICLIVEQLDESDE